MEGFKSLPKMQHFKEGGHAKAKNMCWGGKAMKKGGEAKHEDIAEDKKLIKKAFKQHDEAEHDKEPTEIKLRKGGRTKKEAGTVKKYKTGGSVSGSKGPSGSTAAKKESLGPKKADAPSKAATKPNLAGSDVVKTNKLKAGDASKLKKVESKTKEVKVDSAAGTGDNSTKKFKKGGEVKKYADGSSVIGTPEQKRIAAERAHQMNLFANINKLRDPSQQAQLMAQQQAIGGNNSLNQIANQMNPPGQQMGTPAAAPAAPVGQPQPTNMGAMQAPGGVSPAGPIPGQKRGGRAGAC
jgi:hypothetical protein